MTELKLEIAAVIHRLENKEPFYVLFAGCVFYPSGGWDDHKGFFLSEDNAKAWLEQNEPDANFMWAHITYNHKIILWASCQNNQWLGEDGTWEWRTEE